MRLLILLFLVYITQAARVRRQVFKGLEQDFFLENQSKIVFQFSQFSLVKLHHFHNFNLCRASSTELEHKPEARLL